MLKMIDGNKVLIAPVTAEDLKDIHIRDIVYYTGEITTCRDVAHRRLVELGRELPISVEGKAIFHAGPIVRKKSEDGDAYEMVSVGPTTSMRMERFEKEFVEQTGVKVIVGKGGMGSNTEEVCRKEKAIFCVIPAGCAVVAATAVKEITDHNWDELGMPETLWTCDAEMMGPLIVAIDTEGRNLFAENKARFNEVKEAVYQDIIKEVGFIR